MVNKTFTSNTDGSTVRIVEQIDNDIVALDNGQRVSLKRLTDSTYYTENVDPSSFFNRDASVYNSFINTIKSIPDSHIKDSDGQTKIIESGIYTDKAPTNTYGQEFYGNKETVPVYHDDPEEEKKQLLSKYNGNGNANAVMSQAEKFKDLLDEDVQVRIPAPIVNDSSDVNDGPVTRIMVENVEQEEVSREYQQPKQQPVQQNPQTQMFKGIKRNTDFKVKLELDNKIPRPDFISMWEDSYEASIIEFLADEFTNTLLSNPSLIKDQIITQLRLAVYGKEPKKEVAKAPKKAPVKKVKAKVENQMTKTAKIETTTEEKTEVKVEKKGRNKKAQES